ncbi:MAG: sulfurtransferase [Steroidobacteraceae bacterium]|nr:sulfurtransferase [Steroidobacteraceae bacterium]
MGQHRSVRDAGGCARSRRAPRTVPVLKVAVISEISAAELKARRDRGEKPLVIDVREAWELQLASIPDVLHVPMNQVPARVAELSKDVETIVMCHAGGRSMRVAQFLAGQGFKNVANLSGGIAAWSEAVDATVPQY